MTIEPAAPPADPDEVANAAAPQPTGKVCGNCGSPLLGEHCYHCGQPVQGLVRHFTSVLGDIADTLFEIDTRLTRTLLPLLLRPGYLSCEYFAGRRVRYVSPVRLFFFMSVLAFFVAQWTYDASDTQALHVEGDDINSALTVAAVAAKRDEALRALEASRIKAIKIPKMAGELAAAEVSVRRQADRRIAELNAAQAQGKPPPKHFDQLTFGGDKPWDPITNPIRFASLPAFANGWLNQLAGRAQGNLARIQQNPKLLIDAWMSAVPSTLFVLLPLFAALLEVAYLFKRRLYMEHFIVALHSHAFLCFALLLALVINGLAAMTPSPWLHAPLQVLTVALIVWMPLYILLMQKRVYQQGWFTTVVKYTVLAVIYLVLLSVGAALSMLVKLVWL